jgi:hypothetical protein
MVLAERLERETLNVPVVPAEVALLSAVVGLGEVDQHTPRSETAVVPALVIFPFPVAEVEAILETS